MLKDKKVRELITCENAEGFNQLQFVKAGAGAGKTTSIKNRVLNLVKNKYLVPERMVTITYTTKAANELIVRIREVLENELKNSTLPTEDRKKIEYALSTLAYAKISTFHSFCYDLLREYPIEFKVDPEAEIGEERGQESIYQSCFQHMCEELNFIDGHERAPDLKIFEEFRELATDKVALEFFVTLFSNRDLTCKQVSHAQDTASLLGELSVYLEEFKSLMDRIESEVKKTDDKLYIMYLETIKPYLARFGNLKDMGLAYLQSEELPFKAAGAKTNYNDKSFVTEVKAIMEKMKDVWLTSRAANEVKIYNLGLKSFPYFCFLVEEHKKNYGILDFFDCLYKVKIGLETNAPLKELIQKRFDIVTVDEFQDSDPMQAKIAFMLAEDDLTKLFFVGDPKQSIYGFARADISVYQEVMDSVAKMPKGEVLKLSTNFRSAPEILKFVNQNFKQILQRNPSYPEMTVDYDEMDVSPENEKVKGKVSKWMLEMETDGAINADEKRERESFSIAMKIKEMIATGYNPGDFLILFRTSTSMSSYEDALQKLNISVINTKSKNFLAKSEVVDMLNIIAHVAFPKDNYFKASAHQSVIIQDINEKIFEAILNSDSSLLLKLENVFDLCELKEASIQKNDDRLLQLKINLISLLEAELDSTGNDLKQTIFNLFQKATSEDFISSIKLNDESIYVETKSPNAVRLMTIHAAKGLESKVVIISAHNYMKDMGGCHFVDRKDSTFYPNCSMLSSETAETLKLTDLQEKLEYLKAKTAEEEKRVLYVAATRAIETLVILNVEKSNKFLEPLMNLKDLAFTHEETVKFADYTEEFNRHTVFIKSTFDKVESAFNPGAINKILADKFSSKAVTTIIADKKLFKVIEGRKWGMEFGVLTHKVFETMSQHLFVHKNVSIDTDKIVSLYQKQTGLNFDDLDIAELKESCKKFLKGALAQEIKDADSIATEIPFVLAENYHGVLDLLILKGDNVTIVDWKSDMLKVKADEIKLHYDKQMQLYQNAVQKIVGKNVKSVCCFVSLL